MESNIQIVKPGVRGELTGSKGEICTPPPGWTFLPAGDAGITRKVTSQGAYWRVEAKRAVQQIRLTDEYQKKQIYAAERREKKQIEYDAEFCRAVECFLDFHGNYKELEQKLAKAVTNHAIPVGSGTVARTQMIPVEERAALAVMAWMRHQTTAYDQLKIARVKGERRAVRRSLAQQSAELLAGYREGRSPLAHCPLQKALEKRNSPKG